MRIVVSCSGKFHAFALVEQLLKHGHDVVFFTSYSSISNTILKYIVRRKDSELIDDFRFRTNILVAILLKLFKNNPQIANDLFDFWVARRIKSIDADVFIGWSGMSLFSIKVAKSRGWRTILERGSTHILHQQEILEVEYAKRKLNLNFNKRTISKELFEYQSADTISIPSQVVLDSFLRFKIPAEKLKRNSYGVSLHFSRREKSNIGKFIVLYLGTFSIRKGAYYLSDAIQNIKDVDIDFWIIGDAECNVKPLLKDLSKKENVFVFGHVSHFALNRLIKNCTVAIHPSLEEGQSMVLAQVMKVGIPYIATKNSGAEELIVDGYNGIIIPASSSEVIVSSILHLYENKRKLEDITVNLRRQQIQEFSWDSYGMRYQEILEN